MEHRAARRIFLGSSTETRALAQRLQEQIASRLECVPWYEDFFTLGNYVYTDLVQKVITFDYAIMIGGRDDEVTRISTGAKKNSPRDNIYLEYGLFSGILSPSRVLFLMHKSCTVATDLTGMTLQTYETDEEAVEVSMQWLKQKMNPVPLRTFGMRDIELLPTVGVVVGYFYNFLKPLSRTLQTLSSQPWEHTVVPLTRKGLTVEVPTFLCDDVGEYQQELAEMRGLREIFVGRYRVLADPAALTEGRLVLYDVPSILLVLFKTVNYVFGISDGNTPDTVCAKQRALENFCDNLTSMIENDRLVRRFVTLHRYDGEQE